MITPYVRTEKGTWSLPENVMVGIFNHMKELGLDKTVFVSGGVDSPLEWMQFIQHSKNVVHVVGEDKIYQIAWLNSFGCNYAFAHFCCFPAAWGKTTVEAGKQSISYWFNDLKAPDFQLDVIMGMVPAINNRAIEYVTKLGLIELGTVPMIKYQNIDATGAYFCYITREDFENG